MEAPRAEGAPFSLPAHLYPDEVLDDLTISPYASFTSLSEPRPTMLSGWLDKLSPQGYVPTRGTVKPPRAMPVRWGHWAPCCQGSQTSPQEDNPLGCPGRAARVSVQPPWGKRGGS